MKVLLAEHSGFCFGVRRAIQLALEANAESEKVCTLGELIHNPQIVQELAEQGIQACECGTDCPEHTVIIRSHGIAKSQQDELTSRGNRIVDATCPYVKRAQELVAAHCEHPVFILGDPAHPEVAGLLSYGNELTRVVQADSVPDDGRWKSLSVISQTTQQVSDLQKLVAQLVPRTLELKVFNTICSATEQRQAATVALAKRSDLMVVIGGKNSSNTRQLHHLSSAYTTSVHIETEDELQESWFAGKKNIGLAAGASTPEQTIVKVYNKIQKINGEAAAAKSGDDLPLFKEESC